MESKSININVLIVCFIGIMGLIITGGLVYGLLSVNPVVDNLNILAAIVSSIVTGLLGIVVGKAL